MRKAKALPKRYSIHVGLNRVDQAAYGGWDGALKGCHNDAHAMAEICRKAGFDTTKVILDSEAVFGLFYTVVSAKAGIAKRGDTVVITYSGHGGQARDYNGDEPDKLDETLCFWDGQVSDDKMMELFGLFAKGVNVVWVSDSCHSESNLRAVKGRAIKSKPGEVIGKVWYPQVPPAAPVCTLIGITGCKDAEYSYDGDVNGAFTEALLKVHNTKLFSYAMAIKLVRKIVNAPQTPQLVEYSGSKQWKYKKMFN